jgi:hypothetical protein
MTRPFDPYSPIGSAIVKVIEAYHGSGGVSLALAIEGLEQEIEDAVTKFEATPDSTG